MFDMLLKMFMAYVGTRALYDNACDLMDCAIVQDEYAYWLDERNRRRHELDGQERLFESIGVPYIEVFDAFLQYSDNPCEKEASAICLALLPLVH